jgi:biotin carboxylase
LTGSALPSVLLIGADRYLLRACVQAGADTVCVTGPGTRDEGAVSVPAGVRAVFAEDQKNPEAVLAALHRAGLGARRFDAVLTANEYALVFAAVLARVLGCRGTAPEVAVRFRDKWLQKRLIAAAGLATARSTLIEDIRYLGDSPLPDPGRAVLKPAAGVGTALTAEVTTEAELRAAAATFARQRPRVRTYVVEEFIDGEEWLVDGVVFGGELMFWSVASYRQPCLATLQRRAPLTFRRFDPAADAQDCQAAGDLTRRALAVLGLTDGVFHLEMFREHGTGRLVFSECAARRGAALVHEEVQFKFNVDLGEEALRCALGRAPRLDVKVAPEQVGAVYLNGRPGTLVSCPSAAQVMARAGARYVRVELPAGSLIEDGLPDTSTRVAQVMVAADSAGLLARRQDELCEWFGERLVIVPAGATPRMLREWQRRTWPGEDLADVLYGPAPAGGEPVAGQAGQAAGHQR